MRKLTSGNWLDVFLAFALVSFGALTALSASDDGSTISMDMAVSTSPGGQIFYDQAGQFSEAHSVRLALTSDGAFHTSTARLPLLEPGSIIRIDPGSAPGRVVIRKIVLSRGRANVTIEGSSLSKLQLLNHLQIHRVSDVLALTSIGDDPSFSFEMPAGLERAPLLAFASKFASPIALFLLAVIFVRHGSGLPGVASRTFGRYALLLVPMTLAVIWALAATLNLGCPSQACVSGRSFGYGALLTLAALALAVIGACIMIALGRGSPSSSHPALFLWILVGQAGLIVYIYLRSLVASIAPLPITKIEILLIAGASLVYLYTKTRTFGKMFDSPRGLHWALIQLSTLAAISVWIADRELPRLVMLSSDPEIHAFFARQVERMGAIPRNREGWGDGLFHYPAGSAVLTYLWSSLSGLDVRNTLAALPLLQCALAAMVIAEAISIFARSVAAKSVLFVTALGVTFAGFLFPLYEQYSHLEGLGRQVSSGAFALFAILLLAHRLLGITSEWIATLAMASVVFCLGVLNPVNVMVPGALAGAFVVCSALGQRRVSPVVLVPPVAALLLLLDPYYAAMIFDGNSAGAGKVALDPDIRNMSIDELVSAWMLSIRHTGELLRLVVTFPAASPLPSFLVLFASMGALLLAMATGFKKVARGCIFAASLIAILWLLFGVFAALRTDARFFLLAPYFEFSLVQHKALLLTFMSGIIVALVQARYRQPLRTVLVGAAIVLLVAAVVRPIQPHRLEPRYSYCGSMGCPTQSDLEVIQKFPKDPKTGGRFQQERILVPNSINQMGSETWLFPVGGSRLLAQESDIPLAFYYYQGDDDYTTANYVRHVCNKFDRKWLRSEHIRYVFLPADRSTACIASMETLRYTERVVASSGNSYLLELR